MSVLETPRLVFRGQITWDPVTTNNYPALYDENDSTTIFDATAADVDAFRKEAIADVITKGQGGVDKISNWNPHGTHRATYFDTSVVGVDIGSGLNVDDPIVKCPVSFMGMLVDLEPYGSVSSQLFFDAMSFGIQGGCRVYAPRTTRMIGRYINFGRNPAGFIAGVASVVWQTSFPKANGLRIDPHDSALLLQLATKLADEDVLGLTVRWNSYCTLYFDARDPTANNLAVARQLQANLTGGGFQPNPARSQLVGVLGLWRKGEPPDEPGDRALLTQNAGPIASAHVRLTADQVTLDLANSIPEKNLDRIKQDFGDLTLIATDGISVTTLGTFGYDAYGKEAYEASAGIITLKVDPDAAKKAETADIKLRQKNGTVLLAETAVRAVAVTPNVYLDEGETTTLSVQVLDRGRPTGAGIDVTLVSGSSAGPAVTSATNAQGIATFPLAGKAGGLEWFMLALDKNATAPNLPHTQTMTYVYVRTLAADADIGAMQPTWDNVHHYVLRNWQAMAPCMDNWLDLGNPDQVKSFAPLLHKLTAKENFEAFRFMPVVRDMTAGQRALLYAFLDGAKPLALAAKAPPRLSLRQLSRAMRSG
jgi:hypothetical protein